MSYVFFFSHFAVQLRPGTDEGVALSCRTIPHRAIPRSVRVWGPVVLLVALALYLAAYLRWPSLASQVDLLVYRFGAVRVWDGQDLYSVGMTGNSHTMLFDYTPFAALCFLPLIGLSQPATSHPCVLLVNIVCVGYIVRRMLNAAGIIFRHRLWGLTALLMAPIIWLEPVRLSLQLGQINVLMMAFVLADVLSQPSRRWTGIGIGIAAGYQTDSRALHCLSRRNRATSRGSHRWIDVHLDHRSRFRSAAGRFEAVLAAWAVSRRTTDLQRPAGEHQPDWSPRAP